MAKRFLGVDSGKNSRFVVVPCPHEVSTTYGKGTKNGPAAILKASEQIEYCTSEAEAITTSSPTPLLSKERGDSVDVVIIATDWPQFRGLGGVLLQSSSRPLIMDGRRMLASKYNELPRESE